MFAVTRKDDRGDVLVAVRGTAEECASAILLDVLVRMAMVDPKFRARALAVGAGRNDQKYLLPDEEDRVRAERSRYVVERLG